MNTVRSFWIIKHKTNPYSGKVGISSKDMFIAHVIPEGKRYDKTTHIQNAWRFSSSLEAEEVLQKMTVPLVWEVVEVKFDTVVGRVVI